jgi:hypothetical protein
MTPLLLAAADSQSHRVRDVAENAADYFHLPENLGETAFPMDGPD